MAIPKLHPKGPTKRLGRPPKASKPSELLIDGYTDVIDLTTLRPMQLTALHYQLDNPAATYEEIAQYLTKKHGKKSGKEYKTQTVANWGIKGIASQVIANPIKAGMQHLNSHVLQASNILIQQMKSTDPRVAQNAARLILEYAIGKPVQKQEISGVGGGPVPIVTLGMSLDNFGGKDD